ncbi:MAG: chloramphenicol acetyltransferase [Clostridium argentinense]|uniref:Chloramphenicol acetyltransferase n=1 Tax=Clostridium faecium TaxID=2762223 RepID=A0ABR8YRB1_9CLOT|nr:MULTISPECIES: chloramphenicol acetyltransferase [Clostridium]MBD8046526.1 chloramphenicol acetyltransferase [Clostridium faecium]MBS5823001.1 chloramphenicol acetyltransferase [Clostridium argentinense]MDU1349160.1 chloramphenicol acetyltransferase [Clostridium argentinense]
MKYIDMENWARKDHYNHFKALDYPHFNICGNIDITQFYKFIKENENPFFISFLFFSVKVANSIKEFRYRIRENKVIEHDAVNPAFTIMTNQGVCSFCTVEYINNYDEFIKNAKMKIDIEKNDVNLKDEPGRDDLLFITSVPWISFTSVTHPIHMNPVDSVPRITWGKFFEENGKIKIPLSIQAHHALLDGEHVGKYFNLLQDFLNNPEENL